MSAERIVARLEARVLEGGSAIVAFSGGVDSSLVAAIAARALGDRALAVTAASPAVPRDELVGAVATAAGIGIAHAVVNTHELADPDYRRNDRFRCLHCKTELYARLARVRDEHGYDQILSGANADDAGDWRPGLRAAADRGVRSPLLELGIDKRQVRELAALLGLPTADKPASPCLASRIPYGTAVDIPTLARIEAAEAAIRRIGARSFRVRHHGELGRIEVAADEIAWARGAPIRAALLAAVLDAGYARAELAEEPLRSGSLNVWRSGTAPV